MCAQATPMGIWIVDGAETYVRVMIGAKASII